MSEPRKNSKKKPEHTSVDWAEKLKASMNEDYEESSTTQSMATDDDLAALLRAQLGKTSAKPSLLESLDTSDFEEDYREDDPEEYIEEEPEEYTEEESEEYTEEESEEYIEEEPEEYTEEEPEEYTEEESEEYTEEESEEYIEEESEEYIEEEPEEYTEEESEEYIEEESEEYTEEESEEYIEEESEEYTEEEPEEYIEEESEEYTEEESEEYTEEESEEYIEEESEEYIEEEPEEYTEEESEEYTEEEYEEYTEEESEIFEAEESEDYDEKTDDMTIAASSVDQSAPSGVGMYYRRPIRDYLSDDRLNGLSPNEMVGGHRLRMLDEQNSRLLEQENVSVSSWNTGEEIAKGEIGSHAGLSSGEVSPATDETDPELREEHRTDRARKPYIYIQDSLQLGLDDISPIPPYTDLLPKEQARDADPSVADESGEGNCVIYTEAMTQSDETEETLRDTELIMKLGYEASLHHAEQQARIDKISEKTHENRESSSDKSFWENGGHEYRGRDDTDRVEAAYVRAKNRNTARLWVAGLGVLFALVYDLIPLLIARDVLTERLDLRWVALAGLSLMVCICLPFVTRLARGFKSLLDFEPDQYAVASISVAVSLIHNGIACWVGDPYTFPLFCSPGLFMLLLGAVSEYLVKEGEHRAFTVVSCGKPIHILTGEITPAAAALNRLEENSNADQNRKKVVGGKKHRILTVVRAGRIADYFARTKRYNPYMGHLNYLLPAALLAAILCAGFKLVMEGSFLMDGVRTFTATYLACLSGAYLLAMSYPLFYVNGVLSKKGSAVIGSAAPSEYAGKYPACLIFPDGDALKSLYRKDITLRGDDRSEECRRMADWVFRLLNTPLAVEPAIRDGYAEDYRIDIAEVQENSIRLYLIDDRKERTTEIMMGSHEALTRSGIRLPKINMEQRYKKSEGSHVLYMAFNRSFHLAYAVEYRVGRTFAHVAMALSDMGYRISISAFDPLVNPDMEGINRLRKNYPMEVIRPTGYESVRRIRSGGLIATGRSMDLVQPLTACHDMDRVYRRGHLISWLSIPVTLILSALTICLGSDLHVMAGVVTAWQFLNAALIYLVSRTAFRHKNTARDAEKDKKAKEPKLKQKKKK